MIAEGQGEKRGSTEGAWRDRIGRRSLASGRACKVISRNVGLSIK